MLLGIMIFMFSCNIDDSACKTPGYGKFKVTNGSLNTVQRIIIDGTNYGSLDPGNSKEISLAAGKHDYTIEGISGGSGCSPASVIIVECQTEGRQCNN